MQTNSQHDKLFHFHVLVNLESVEQKRKKLQKFEYLEIEKNFFDEVKKHFLVFKGLSFGEK